MKLIISEVRTFFGISILMSCLKYPQIKMYWAKMAKVSSIATSMTRDMYFQIKRNLKVVIDSNVSEDHKKADKIFKIRPCNFVQEIVEFVQRITKVDCHFPGINEIAVDE